MRFYFLSRYDDPLSLKTALCCHRERPSLEVFLAEIDEENKNNPQPHYQYIPTSCLRKILGCEPYADVWTKDIPMPPIDR